MSEHKHIKKQLSWDEYFMKMAFLVCQRSQCTRKNVGCVITKNNRIISTGYNGFIEHAPHISIVRDNHEQATIHAEVNAVCDCAKRGVNMQNATVYVTHFPCLNCFKTLAASGVNTIFYCNNYKNDDVVYQLAEHSKIELIQFNIEETHIEEQFNENENTQPKIKQKQYDYTIEDLQFDYNVCNQF